MSLFVGNLIYGFGSIIFDLSYELLVKFECFIVMQFQELLDVLC